jgi:hypothetical protein
LLPASRWCLCLLATCFTLFLCLLATCFTLFLCLLHSGFLPDASSTLDNRTPHNPRS